MPSFGFIGPSYVSENPSVANDRLVNLYPELIESGTGPSKGAKYAYYNRPGLTLLANLGSSGRALWGGNNRLFAVIGSNLLEVNASGSVLHTYTIGGSGPAQIVFVPSGPGLSAPSSGALLVWDGSNGSSANVWYVDGTTSTPPAVISGVGVGCIDGYGVVLRPPIPPGSSTDPIPINTIDGTQFNLSQEYVANVWDPLQYAIKTGAPDQLQAVYTPGSAGGAGPEELWLFGKVSAEVWYDTGGSTLDPFPFQRVSGAFVMQGMWAANSAAALDNSIFWLGGDQRGPGVVYRSNGYTPVRVSNHAVEYAIQQYVLTGSDISDAIGYTYEENGHGFYVLNFPTAGATWVYDITTQMWHERAHSGVSGGQLGYYHAWTLGKHFLLDSSGNLYSSSIATYQDNGNTITWQRTAPHVGSEFEWMRINQFMLMFGPSASITRNFTFEVSKDQGLSFPVSRSLSAPAIPGQPPPYQRISARQLGRARDWVFRVTSTDNCQQAWIDAFVK